MRHTELPLFAFLTAVLVIIPLPWHWRDRNVATVALILWLFVVDVIYGVNAVVWAGNVQDPAPVWCDISTKLVVGASYALPLCTLCICKHLEAVSSTRKTSYDIKDRHRRMIFESIMCFGLPCIFMTLHYVVQGHRYDIFEDFGCQPAFYISLPAVFIVWFPQLLFSLITLIYAAIAFLHFMQRRMTFGVHLQDSKYALTPSRYLRLIAMSLTETVWGTTLTSYNLYNNIYPGLRPWTNWAGVHSNFSQVAFYPAVSLPPQVFSAMMFLWWAMPASSFIFFIFGLDEEALREYGKVWMLFRRYIFRVKDEEKGGPKLSGILPRFRGPRPLQLVEHRMEKARTLPPAPYITSPIMAPKSPTTALQDDERQFTNFTLSHYQRSTADSIHILNDDATPKGSHNNASEVSLARSESTSHSRARSHSSARRSSYWRDNLPPSPVHYPPFCSPTICPIPELTNSQPHPQNVILVTIHRQASTDDVV
ncbi:hypothetical protein AMATHDRAFT_179768 [Amanita thiersii Skay4041]|uniref:STE3-domain-containing protein n=1 Tax=Amanita thiersii Skay4041 TaxID=703135 RepID=A0A2A9NKJ9_9AGAR|nr:hypothetical protein AMATHDRAFT_179768 [Amanita thiersii Skay4041]